MAFRKYDKTLCTVLLVRTSGGGTGYANTDNDTGWNLEFRLSHIPVLEQRSSIVFWPGNPSIRPSVRPSHFLLGMVDLERLSRSIYDRKMRLATHTSPTKQKRPLPQPRYTQTAAAIRNVLRIAQGPAKVLNDIYAEFVNTYSMIKHHASW